MQKRKIEWNEVITDCDNLGENLKFDLSTPFTEQGIPMLSSVIRSKKAIELSFLRRQESIII